METLWCWKKLKANYRGAGMVFRGEGTEVNPYFMHVHLCTVKE